MTNNLVRRIWEHREELVPGFTRKYGVHRLVWFQAHGEPGAAMHQENRLKHWLRAWKIELIEKGNPHWKDLWDEINQP